MVKIIRFNNSILENDEFKKKGYKIIEDHLGQGKVILIVGGFERDSDFFKGLDKLTPKEQDLFLALKNIKTSLIVSGELNEIQIGARAISINELGVMVDKQYGDGHVVNLDSNKIKDLLKKYDVLVIPGGYGKTKDGEVCSLGKNSLDLTSVCVALGLEQTAVYLYGSAIYSVDPKILFDAVLIDEISYDKALCLAKMGVNIIDYQAIELAQKYQIELKFNSLDDDKMVSKISDVKGFFNGAMSVIKGFSKIELEMCELLKREIINGLDFESIIATKIVDKPFLVKLILQNDQLEVFSKQLENIIKKYSVEPGYVLVSLIKEQESLWEISKEILINYGIEFHVKEISDHLIRLYVKEADFLETVKILHEIWIQED